MQTRFEDMVGAAQPVIAGRILADTAHAALSCELDGLTPALNAAAGPQADASGFAGTGYIDICGWIQNEPAEANVASAQPLSVTSSSCVDPVGMHVSSRAMADTASSGPISTIFGSCITQEAMNASAKSTIHFGCQ